MITFDMATKAAEQTAKCRFSKEIIADDTISQLCIHSIALNICEGLRIANFILRSLYFIEKKTITSFAFPSDYSLEPVPLKIALIAIQNLYGKENYFSRNENGSFNVIWGSQNLPEIGKSECLNAELCIAVSTGDKEKILQAAKNADINYPGPFGRTPLFFNLHCPITHRLLVSIGAARHTDQFGLTSEKFVEGMHREIR